CPATTTWPLSGRIAVDDIVPRLGKSLAIGANHTGVTRHRWVLACTAASVAVLAGVFAVLGWEHADKAASVVSALTGVAAVGVAIWAAAPAASGGGNIRVSKTGRATARGHGLANTGMIGPADALKGDVQVERTGDAEADAGDANTDVHTGQSIVGYRRMKSTIRETGDAVGGSGSLVNTGQLIVHGDVNLGRAPVVRSALPGAGQEHLPLGTDWPRSRTGRVLHRSPRSDVPV